MKTGKRILLLLFCVLSVPLYAQQKLKITLDQAVEIALSENPTIKIANEEIARQKYVRKETIGGLIPNVSGSGSYAYNIMNPVMFMPAGIFGDGGPMRMGFDNSYNAGVNVSLPLYMPTLYKTLRLNEQQMIAAVEAARASKVELAAQVKKAYFAILLGENSLQVIKDNIYYAGVVVENSRNSYAQGVISEYDLITAEVQLSNLTPNLIQVENSVRNGRLFLNMLLSLPLDAELEMEEVLTDYMSVINSNSEYAIDLSENTQLRQLQIQMDIMGKQLELQRSTRIPTLSAIAQYDVQSQSNDFKIGHYEWRGSALAGLQLQIPIFAGLSRISKEKQIKSSISQVAMQRDYAEANMNVEARTALSNMIRSKQQVESSMVAQTQAQKGYKISKTRYEVGGGTIIEVNSAQMALLQANLNYSQSIFDYMSAKTDYEKVVGKIN
ncbi:MAG: TolC family protein [Rikenellaceae bacterium]